MKECMEGFGERKGKGEMPLNCNLKINNNKNNWHLRE